jgi:tellurite resistance protein TerC
MTAVDLFPLAEYWWLYLAFTGFVFLLLFLDLGVFHRNAHVVSFREAAVWSVVWVVLALLFNFGLYSYARLTFADNPRLNAIEGFDAEASATQVGLEFLTGYVVEKSLAVDNIFVFVVVFTFFAVPPIYQHRVLFYGIIGALAFRAVFIALGSILLQYEWIVIIFGALLILTGIKMMFAPEKGMNPEKNILIRLFRRWFPVTPEFHNERFFVRLNGVMHATPLFVALLFLEFSDIIFAIDSVPAIFALTDEPLIVFTSNIFAILGLRSMYFMLAGAVERFTLLKYGLALVLVFVGLKMVWLNDLFGGKFPIQLSLGIIAGIIAVSIGVSLWYTRGKETGTQN